MPLGLAPDVAVADIGSAGPLWWVGGVLLCCVVLCCVVLCCVRIFTFGGTTRICVNINLSCAQSYCVSSIYCSKSIRLTCLYSVHYVWPPQASHLAHAFGTNHTRIILSRPVVDGAGARRQVLVVLVEGCTVVGSPKLQPAACVMPCAA